MGATEGGKSILKWHIHVREVNILKIHQAPSSCNSKLRPLDPISRLNPSLKSGSNITINHKKVKEFQQGITCRYAFYVILFVDMLWPVIPGVFILPWPCSCGQPSPFVLVYAYYMPTLELDAEIHHFLQEANSPLLLGKLSKLPSQVSERTCVLVSVENKNSIERLKDKVEEIS